MLTQTKYFHPFHKKQKQVTLVCPHSSRGQVFFNAYPQILDHLENEKKSEFLEFLQIEEDRGAHKLANKLAQSLFQISKSKINVMVIEIDYPRGVLDGGRVGEKSLRNFIPEDILNECKIDWLKIHHSTIDIIRKELMHTKQLNGLYIDLHTMCPWTPQSKMLATHDFRSVGEYIASWKQKGEKRQINLMVSDHEGNFLAQQKLCESLEVQLKQSGFASKRDDPYRLSPDFMMTEYLKVVPGIGIDVPKDLLAEDGDFSLSDFRVDGKKVERLGQTIAKAVWECME